MDFYYSELSPPCRAVLLTAKAVGAKLNKKPIDLQKGEHLKPDYVKINPYHTVPTFTEGDLKMWESRAICTYLASQHGKDESLYPKDPKKRAVIDNLLFFDMGTLTRRLGEYAVPVMFGDEKPDPEKKKSLEEALKWLDDILDGHDFCTGDKITVADFVLIATISSIIEAELVDIAKYKHIKAWADKCKSKIAGYDTENGKGAKAYGELAKPKFSNSKPKTAAVKSEAKPKTAPKEEKEEKREKSSHPAKKPSK